MDGILWVFTKGMGLRLGVGIVVRVMDGIMIVRKHQGQGWGWSTQGWGGLLI